MATTKTRVLDVQQVPGVGKVVTKCQTIAVGFADFEAAATSDTVDGDAITNFWPVACFGRLTDKFAAPSATDGQMTVGDSGDADGLHATLDVHASGSLGTSIGLGADLTAGTYHASFTPRLTLTLTGDNCADLTAGGFAADIVYRTVEAD